MDFARPPLLDQKQRNELETALTQKWSEKGADGKLLTGMQIAKQLKFGVPGTTFEMLQPRYVYFYRQQFDLPLRAKPRFKKDSKTLPNHRYNKTHEELELMTPEDFVTALNAKLPRNQYTQVQRCFLIILYWTPLRESEIWERVQNVPLAEGKVRNDFEILSDKIIIHLLRKKKKSHLKADEPISIPRSFDLIEEVVEYLQSKSWEHTFASKPNKVKKLDSFGFQVKAHGVYQWELNHRPFPISKTTADNWVKQVFEGFYCHYFRFAFITAATQIPNVKVSELRAKTYLSLGALEHYIFTPKRSEEDFDAKKAKELHREV